MSVKHWLCLRHFGGLSALAFGDVAPNAAVEAHVKISIWRGKAVEILKQRGGKQVSDR